jgi:hypothetical protein
VANDLEAVRGDTNEYDLTITRGLMPDGVTPRPVNLTGAVLKLTVKRSADDTAPLVQLTVGAGITIDADPTTGKCTAVIAPAVFAGVPARSFLYDVELTEGTRVTTVAEGRLRLTADVS